MASDLTEFFEHLMYRIKYKYVLNEYDAPDVSLNDVEKAFNFLTKSTYKSIHERMDDDTYNEADVNTVLHNLIYYLHEYFQDLDNTNAISFDSKIAIKTFEIYEKRMRDNNFNPHGMNMEGKLRVFREASIEAADFIDKQSLKTTSLVYITNTYKSALTECTHLLNDGDRTFRGSSKAYKELQREIKKLNNFMNNNNSNADKQYISVMFKALAEKAEQYISDRHDTELKHSSTGYKGVRIANMRKVLNRLNACDRSIGSIVMLNPLEPKAKNLLENKFSSMTFSGEVYKRICGYPINTHTDDINTIAKTLHSDIIRADAINGYMETRSQHTENGDMQKMFKEYIDHIKTLPSAELKNIYTVLKDARKAYNINTPANKTATFDESKITDTKLRNFVFTGSNKDIFFKCSIISDYICDELKDRSLYIKTFDHKSKETNRPVYTKASYGKFKTGEYSFDQDMHEQMHSFNDASKVFIMADAEPDVIKTNVSVNQI